MAIELIATHIRRKIDERSRYLRERLARIGPQDLSPGDPTDQEFPNLTVLQQTRQLQVCIVCPISVNAAAYLLLGNIHNPARQDHYERGLHLLY